MHTKMSRMERAASVAAVIGAAMLLLACAAEQTVRAVDAEVTIDRDVPRVLEGTIGSLSRLDGLTPEVVSGYGIVVGLNGTGSVDLPIGVRAVMEREMLRQGVGREMTDLARVTPDQMLDDPNTAVVLVQALLPPGAPVGATFDVRVSAVPGSGATSLQGGRLYTAELRRGVADPSAPDTPPIALARGPIFINPFRDPADPAAAQVRGRILDGGTVITPFRPTLTLDSPSHSRAMQVERAVNSRFPSTGMREDTARGLNEEVISITIPQTFKDRTDEFISLLEHTQINLIAPAEYAALYARAIKEQPSLADDLAWALEALGAPAIPAVRPLYEDPEIVPRMTALQVGARLRDATTGPHLRRVIESGPEGVRTGAIRLLGLLPPDPKTNLFLRELLNDEDITVRLAAYEALEQRGDVSIRRGRVGDVLELATVPSRRPMIFFAQGGRPRLVVFGQDLELERPLLVTAWASPVNTGAGGSASRPAGGDLYAHRLVITAEHPRDDVRVLYRDHRTGRATRTIAPVKLDEFIRFLAHEPTPEDPSPGLGLGYSEIVGALHEIIEQGGLDAILWAERNVREVEFVRKLQEAAPRPRPEFASDEPREDLYAPLVDPEEALGDDGGGAAPAPSPRPGPSEDDDRRWLRMGP